MAEINEGQGSEGLSDLEILENVPDDDSDDSEDSGGDRRAAPKKPTQSGDEEKEDEEELVEASGEEDEEEEPIDEDELREVNLQSIVKKYPKILKEFPDLRDSLKTAEEFKNVFDNADQAKAAVEQANFYLYFQDKIMQGDAEELLASVKNSGDSEALARFAENLLPSLHKVDEALYYRTSAPILRQALYAALKESESTGVEDLGKAAKWIHRFIFGSTDIKQPEFRRPQDNGRLESERQRLMEERMNWERQRMSEAMSEVSDSITSDLKRMILKDLDPQGKIQPYIKKKLVSDIVSEVGNTLQNDRKHIANMDNLWQRFHRGGMPASAKVRIKDTYLAKAQTVLPAIKSKLRAEALGTKSNDGKFVQKPGGGSGKNQSQMRSFKSSISPSKVDYSKTSDLDLIEGRAVLKKG